MRNDNADDDTVTREELQTITTGRPARHTPPGTFKREGKAAWQRRYRASKPEQRARQNALERSRRAAAYAVAKNHPEEFALAIKAERARRGIPDVD